MRYYSRIWPTIFATAHDSNVVDENGRSYIDFFAGAGALNYGHNNPALKKALIEYISKDGIVHSLDMTTTAKVAFLETFHDLILAPRGLNYKVQFTGPAGTDAVEAALKIARKVTGRPTVASFTGAFHGVSLGSLSVSANEARRGGAGVPLRHCIRFPFDGYSSCEDGLERLDTMLQRSHNSQSLPGAVIVETVQAEGGVNVARINWLQTLAKVCQRHHLLLIVDDIQVGCGRTGPFFSFEHANLSPDIICLSKSISGYGLPMALVLLRPELDIWAPGEHTGTFRGNNLAFVTATRALKEYWGQASLERSTAELALRLTAALAEIKESAGKRIRALRGRGLIQGLVFAQPEVADATRRFAFERGILVETAGSRGEVIKLLPPLTVSRDDLDCGLSLLAQAVQDALELHKVSLG